MDNTRDLHFSLHDALPISCWRLFLTVIKEAILFCGIPCANALPLLPALLNRSEEHTSELQSQSNLVCRLLLEKKKRVGKTRERRGVASRTLQVARTALP